MTTPISSVQSAEENSKNIGEQESPSAQNANKPIPEKHIGTGNERPLQKTIGLSRWDAMKHCEVPKLRVPSKLCECGRKYIPTKTSPHKCLFCFRVMKRR